MQTVTIAPVFESWQAAARVLLADGVAPGLVEWREAADAPAIAAPPPGGARVPRQFLDVARQAAAASDPMRWSTLYAVLWRLVHESRDLLTDGRDPDVRRLNGLAAQGRREGAAGGDARGRRARAAGRRRRAVRAQGRHARRAARGGRALRGLRALPQGDPDGVRPRARRRARGAGGRAAGRPEDLKGAPFVGPAGEVLDRALAEAGLDRTQVYVTNAVKHFSFVERGRRRIHQTPRLPEIAACRPWLEAELEVIKPRILGCLGATAARAILGPDFRLMRQRGQFFETRWSARTIATFHPSAILRGQDDAEQARLYGMLRDDLRLIAAG
jgi:uracil-DNA glycosylase family 4